MRIFFLLNNRIYFPFIPGWNIIETVEATIGLINFFYRSVAPFNNIVN